MLQFKPYATAIEPELWHALRKHKLEIAGLSDAPMAVQASQTPGTARLLIHTPRDAHYALSGHLYNYNTIEEFTALDKPAFLQSHAQQVRTEV